MDKNIVFLSLYDIMSLAELCMYAESSIRRNHHGANGDVV